MSYHLYASPFLNLYDATFVRYSQGHHSEDYRTKRPYAIPSSHKTWTVVHLVVYPAFEDVKKSDIIICNMVHELEFETHSALNANQPTYAIGPIVSAGFTKRTVSTSLWSESDWTQWLNTKPNGSILHVLFGSHARTASRK